MAINPKKMKSFIDKETKSPFGKKKKKDEGGDDGGKQGKHDDHEDHDEHVGDKDKGKGGGPKVNVEKIVKRILDGHGDKKLMKLAEEHRGEDAGEAPSWAENEELWEKAHDLMESHEEELGDDFCAAVAHAYQQLGGKIEEHEGGEHDEEDEDEDEEDEHDEHNE